MRDLVAVVNNDSGFDGSAVVSGGYITFAPDFKLPTDAVKGSEVIVVTPEVGVAGKLDVTIAGTYDEGDRVKLTIESNLTSRQKFLKSYTVAVTKALAGNNNAIAAKLAEKFTSELNAGLIDYPIASVSVATNVVTITQVGDDKFGIKGYGYADSASGTIAIAETKTVKSEGYPDDLVDAGIASDNIDLATYDTVRLKLNLEVAQPFINSKGIQVKELIFFCASTGAPSEGAEVKTVIDAL